MAQIPEEFNLDAPVSVDETKSAAEFEDEAAASLIRQDAQSAMEFLEKNQWSLIWDEIDILLDPPRPLTTWENTNVVQPSVTRSKVATHANALHTQLCEGLFYEDPCFEAEGRLGADADAVRARAACIAAQLDNMDFVPESEEGLLGNIVYGYSVFKWGMRYKTHQEPKFTRKTQPHTYTSPLGEENTVNTEESDDFDFEMIPTKKWEPFFESRDIREVLFDPSLKRPFIHKGKFVIDKYYATLEDLLEWRTQPCYKDRLGKYSEEEIKSWFDPTNGEEPAKLGSLDNLQGATTLTHEGEPDYKKTTEDPYAQGLLVLERWDNNKVMTLLNDKILIRNEKNILGKIPFYSCNWWDRTRALIGIGIGRTVGADQRLSQGLTNSGLAFLQMLMDPMFVVSDTSNVPNQNIRLRKGGILKVKGSVRDAVSPLELPKMPLGELFAFLQNSNTESEAADGANDTFVQGNMPGAGSSGKTSATRTAGGISAITGAIASRLQGPVSRFVNRVLVPWIYQLDELNRLYLPASQMREIVGEKLGKEVKVDMQKFLDAKLEFDVKAGANLAASRTIAQLLPIITQIFDNPQIQSQLNEISEEYVDISQILKDWCDAAHKPWTQWIKPMTDKMKANQQANNPAAAKVAADAQKEQLKAKNASDLQSQKTQEGIARDLISESFQKGGDELLRQSVEKEGEPGALGTEGE